MYIHGDICTQMNKNMYNFKPLFSIKTLQNWCNFLNSNNTLITLNHSYVFNDFVSLYLIFDFYAIFEHCKIPVKL